MAFKRPYVAKFKDHKGEDQEVSFEAKPDSRQAICSALAEAARLKVERTRDRQNITAGVYELRVVAGRLAPVFLRNEIVPIAARSTTEEEFLQEETQLAEELPEAFRACIRRWAWDLGHASGYDEVLTYLRDMISSFKPCIEEYTEQIRKEDK